MMEYKIRGIDKEEFNHYLNEHIDALLQVENPKEIYQDSIGWWNVDEWASEDHLQAIESLANKIQSNANAFVLIGVGGSNNAARSVIKALQNDSSVEIIYAGNTLNAYALNKMLKSLEGKEVYIDCIAKNFVTLEPGSSFRILREYLENKYKDKAHERIIVTGTKGSELEELSKKHSYAFLEFPMNVGGRFSALSNVGLLPMAVAGIDIRKLVQGAKDIQEIFHQEKGTDNLAYQYACMRNYMYQKGYRIESLSSFEPRLSSFNKWWIQLFGESEGKNNKGLFPTASIFSEELHSIGQFIQEGSNLLFETFINIKEEEDDVYPKKDQVEDGFDYLNEKGFVEINRAAYEATMDAHSLRFACGEISIDKLDAYHFGQLFYFFEFACYISCVLMGVNPFNQPGVEEYKVRMFQVLGKRE